MAWEDMRTIITYGLCIMMIIFVVGFSFAINDTIRKQNDISETTPEPATISAQAPTPIYDVPLDEDLQLYIIQQCETHNINSAIVIAMIWRESSYSADAIGDNGNSIGLMQIQEQFHHERKVRLGCTNLFNPYHNVTVGIDILSELIDTYDGNVEMALMAYNAGSTGAYRNWFSKGVYTNDYSQSVLEKSQNLHILEREKELWNSRNSNEI